MRKRGKDREFVSKKRKQQDVTKERKESPKNKSHRIYKFLQVIAEKKRDFYDRQIKDQEKILHQYINNCQLRTTNVEQAKKNVLIREKKMNEVVKILENQMIVRQRKVDEASAKVS